LLDDLVAKDSSGSEYGMDNMSSILIKFDRNKKWSSFAALVINYSIIIKYKQTLLIILCRNIRHEEFILIQNTTVKHKNKENNQLFSETKSLRRISYIG